ncbi:hypothetical protein VNO77_05252 [Canavalia gladiata]|uniref:Protein EXORDIUM-like 2 n=1 Tax=Canavalia gladiata TaxID=3824 RepID=A0AAN9R8H4_CANGL
MLIPCLCKPPSRSEPGSPVEALTGWHNCIKSIASTWIITNLLRPQLSPISSHQISTLKMVANYNIAIGFSAVLTLLLLPALTVGELVQEQPLVLKYHNGQLLKGRITVNLVWYGTFTPIQRSIIVDFINSLSSTGAPLPSAATWWKTTDNYKGGSSALVVGKQFLHPAYTLGKSLKGRDLLALASKFNQLSSITVVLTAKDVSVDGFCMNRCGIHGSTRSPNGGPRTAYIWVGNSETQCPGLCAWPFHQPIYGPQTPPLVAPNGDVGVDGIIINLATLLAGTVTNPFNNGYFQGPATAPLEAVSACTGVFGSGAYPGYPGRVLVDKTSGASYNAHGANGRRYLVPAMWDPQTSTCKTLV